MSRPDAKRAYEVLDAINANRRHFYMGDWAHTGPHHTTIGRDQLTDPNDCGTTACFAGWTVVLAGYRINNGAVYSTDGLLVEDDLEWLAADLLGLDERTPGLFFVDESEVDDAVEEWFGPRPEAAS